MGGLTQQEEATATLAAITTSACTSTTASTLQRLLRSDDNAIPTDPDNTKENIAPAARGRKATVRGDAKTKSTARLLAKTAPKTVASCALDAGERLKLATDVFNGALKALSAASKKTGPTSKPPSPIRQALRKTDANSPTRKEALRRASNSTQCMTNGARTAMDTTAIAECAHLALTCLRDANKMEEMQLASGMNALTGKLLALGLVREAVRELRSLKAVLEVLNSNGSVEQNGAQAAKTRDEQAQKVTLAGLLDMTVPEELGYDKLQLCVQYQLHVLRLLHLTRRPASIEAALRYLDVNTSTSPTAAILRLSKDAARKTKGAEHLDALSRTLLSICPSVSSAADNAANDVSKHPGSNTVFQLQLLAFDARIRWWRIEQHTYDADKDLWEPLSKCASAHARRATDEASKIYRDVLQGVERVKTLLKGPAEASFPTFGPSILRVLSATADAAGKSEDSLRWTSNLRIQLSEGSASAAAIAAVDVRLAVQEIILERSDAGDTMERVAVALSGDLSGKPTEQDDLLAEVMAMRKAAARCIMRCTGGDQSATATETGETITNGLKLNSCANAILSAAHFLLRYIGIRSSDAEELIGTRFAAKASLASRALKSVLDSLSLLARNASQSTSTVWILLDAAIQDCRVMLDRMVGCVCQQEIDGLGLKVAQIYWTRHATSRSKDTHAKGTPANDLSALQRCVEHLRTSSKQVQIDGHFTIRLERLTTILATSRNYGAAVSVAREGIRWLLDDGVASEVAERLNNFSLVRAWDADERAAKLGYFLKIWEKLRTKINPDEGSGETDEHDLLKLVEGRSVEEVAAVFEWCLKNMKIMEGQESVKVVHILLKHYSQAHPLRKVRVATTMLWCARGSGVALQEELVEMIQRYAPGLTIHDSGQDQGLENYAVHYKASYTMAVAFAQPLPAVDGIRSALNDWSTVPADGIDDIDAYVTQLHLVIDWLGVHGPRKLCITATEALLRAPTLQNQDGKQLPAIVHARCELARQHLYLESPANARRQIIEAQTLLDAADDSLDASEARLHFLTVKAHLHLTLGVRDACRQILLEAQLIASTHPLFTATSKALSFADALKASRLLGDASLALSRLAIADGHQKDAILFAKQTLKLNQRIWASLENSTWPQHPSFQHSNDAVNNVAGSMGQLNVSAKAPVVKSMTHFALAGSSFWRHVPRLFESQMHCADVMAQLGLWQEAVCYAEQAERVARAVSSVSMIAKVSAVLVRYHVQSGRVGKAQERIETLSGLPLDDEDSHIKALVRLEQGRALCAEGETELALEHWEDALGSLDNKSTDVGESHIEAGLRKLTLDEPPKKTSRAPKGRKTAPPKAVPKVPAKQAKSKAAGLQAVEVSDNELTGSCIRQAILATKIEALLRVGDVEAAEKAIKGPLLLPVDNTQDTALVVARHNLDWATLMQQLDTDLDYGTLRESTLAMPLIIRDQDVTLRSSRLEPSAQKSSKRTVFPAKGRRKPIKNDSSMLERLRKLHNDIAQAFNSESIGISDAVVRGLSLSFLDAGLMLASASPSDATVSVLELCAKLAVPNTNGLLSEYGLVRADAEAAKQRMPTSWPDLERVIDTQVDPSSERMEEIDTLLPKAWTIISLSLNNAQDELLVTRHDAGRTPMLLRLPMSRHRSREEDDEDTFTFDDGKAELQDIIRLSDVSTHDGRNMAIKGAKRQWWAEREALDTRLKDLLVNIENIWFGGFKGIFAQSCRSADVLITLQESVQTVLDKHLPSRQGKKQTTRINFDARVLELFVGLGDPSERGDETLCELGDDLMDLLYFLVDILQLNGEHNAYDEIDFDAMMVDTIDALKVYHLSAKATSEIISAPHTILVLDKMLHSFPWECMPCLEQHSVSRLPSMEALRERLTAMRTQSTGRCYPDLAEWRVDRSSGTGILNPSGDLIGTQEALLPHMKQLPASWASYIGPIDGANLNEEVLSDALSSSDIFCYFGHGGTAQYIRPRGVRKLSPAATSLAINDESSGTPRRCATSLLMGCSSAAVTENGEYHPHGMILAYLAAGAPAVVGCLWDVTDKDCDRFSVECGRLWGLWGNAGNDEGDNDTSKKAKKGKSKIKDDVEGPRDAGSLRSRSRAAGRGRVAVMEALDEELAAAGEVQVEHVNLAQAVASSRQACYLKYLNGAAMVMYGIPVVLA